MNKTHSQLTIYCYKSSLSVQILVTDKIFKNHFFAETPSLGYYACRVIVSKCFWKWKCVFHHYFKTSYLMCG